MIKAVKQFTKPKELTEKGLKDMELVYNSFCFVDAPYAEITAVKIAKSLTRVDNKAGLERI